MELKNLLKISAFALTALCSTSAQAQTQTTLFDSPFTSDYGTSMPYRIPAIVKTSNNEIIAFADKRHGGGDVGQKASNNKVKNDHIDLVYRRSSDNGATWGAEQTIQKGTSTMGYGDIAVVADRENPENIVFFCAAGNTFCTNSQRPSGSYVSNTLRCFRFRSSDGGKTWSNQEVTTDIYSLFSNSGAFFSSGRICQSKQIKVGNYYRLYAALCVTSWSSIVLYSDDFGDSWAVLGGSGTVAVPSGNEAKVEELPNGSVLVSSRAQGRYYNVFTYSNTTTGSGKWGTKQHVLTSYDAGQTNGEVLIVPAKDKSGNVCNVLLQSLPIGSGRTKVGIVWKELSADATTSYSPSDFTSGWSSPYYMSNQTSAYSTMVLQGDNNIGFLYEDYLQDLGSGGYDIKYANLPLSTITGGAYSYYENTGGGDDNEGGNEGTGGETETTTAKYRFKNVHMNGSVYYFKYAGEANGLTLTTSESEATLYTRTTVDAANGVYNFQSEDGNYLIFSGRNISSGVNIGENNGLGYLKEYDATYCDLTIAKMVSGDNVGTFTGDYYTVMGKRSTVDKNGKDTGDEDAYFVIKNTGLFDGARVPFYNSTYSSAFVIEAVEVETEGGEGETPVVETVKTPVISLASGEVEKGTQVTISCATEGATVYYTTDGTTPSATNGTVYSGAITINEAMTLSAIAVKEGWTNSAVATAAYTIKAATSGGVVEDGNRIIATVKDNGCTSGNCATGLWSSHYFDCAVNLPSGVKAYRATKDWNGDIVLRRLTRTTIPAYYPVIVIDQRRRTELVFTKVAKGFNHGENILEGTLERIDITAENRSNYYVLGHTSSNHRGFYRLAVGGYIGANKAFIYSGDGSEIKVRFEDEDATGIDDIFTEENDNAPIYDLTGRKVNDTSKPGIYIKNGKKYIVR